jgi:hypothetical protein
MFQQSHSTWETENNGQVHNQKEIQPALHHVKNAVVYTKERYLNCKVSLLRYLKRERKILRRKLTLRIKSVHQRMDRFIKFTYFLLVLLLNKMVFVYKSNPIRIQHQQVLNVSTSPLLLYLASANEA